MVFEAIACLYMKACTGDLAKMVCLYIGIPLLIVIASVLCLPCKLVQCLSRIAHLNMAKMKEEKKVVENKEKDDLEKGSEG